MAHIIELTKSEGQTASTDDDIKILVNADVILKIEDTKDDYAGDTRITFVDGSTLYVCESLHELKTKLK